MRRNIFMVIIILCNVTYYACDKEVENNYTTEFNGINYNNSNGLSEDGTQILDLRDNEVYAVIKIGDQTWMAENLRYDVPSNDTGDVVNPSNTSLIYGRLYDWYTIMNGESSSSSNPSGVRGICPKGWHIPSDGEWNILEQSLGMSASYTDTFGLRGIHGNEMKSTTGWSLNGNGTNSSGFNVYPSGSYNIFDNFYLLGDYAIFWSSSIGLTIFRPWVRGFAYNYDGVSRDDGFGPDSHVSCRCVMD